MAGLAAAQRLVARGLNVEVLEARDRIGGRIWTRHDFGLTIPVELGAEFVHAGAKETRLIARQAGIVVTDVTGRRFVSQRGRLRSTDDFERRLQRVMDRLDEDRVPDRSFAEALSRMRGVSRDDRNLAIRFIEGFQAADTELISERSLVGSVDSSALRTGRVAGGYDQLVRVLGASVLERVRLGRRVVRLTWEAGGVSVETRDASGNRVTVEARAAIITVPLGVLMASDGSEHRIEFDPAIPMVERAASQLVMGGVLRVALRMDEPFWLSTRFVNLAGDKFREVTFIQALSSTPFPVWWTAYPVEAPLLVGWMGGPLAWKLARQSEDAIVSRAITALSAVMGMSRSAIARRVRGSLTHNWMADPFSRGAYSYVGVGGGNAGAVLARPVRNTLFFAGEHASSGRNGTVDGAIASGQRAARQVLRLFVR